MFYWLLVFSALVAALNPGADDGSGKPGEAGETVMEPSPHVRSLIKRLESPDTSCKAMAELGDLGPAAAPGAPRVATFLKDPNWSYRALAAVTLYQMGCGAKAATGELADVLGDEHSEVSFAASLALCEIGQPAVPALIKGLNRPDSRGRRRAAETLGRMGAKAKTALPALERTLSDGDERLRDRVQAAIQQIRADMAP